MHASRRMGRQRLRVQYLQFKASSTILRIASTIDHAHESCIDDREPFEDLIVTRQVLTAFIMTGLKLRDTSDMLVDASAIRKLTRCPATPSNGVRGTGGAPRRPAWRVHSIRGRPMLTSTIIRVGTIWPTPSGCEGGHRREHRVEEDNHRADWMRREWSGLAAAGCIRG